MMSLLDILGQLAQESDLNGRESAGTLGTLVFLPQFDRSQPTAELRR